MHRRSLPKGRPKKKRRMHRAATFTLFLVFCLLSGGGPASAGTAERTGQADGGDGGDAGAAKPVSRVEFKNGLLSVELVDAGFGEVMQKSSEKSGIKVEITGSVYAKTLTTSFSGVDLERGIARLLSFVKEKNYMIRYDAKGTVSKVEVYSSGATPAGRTDTIKPRSKSPADASAGPSAASAPKRTPAVRKNPPASKRILSPLRDSGAERSAAKDTRMDEKGDDGGEGYEEEIPAEPAGDIPAYIPPRRQQD